LFDAHSGVTFVNLHIRWHAVSDELQLAPEHLQGVQSTVICSYRNLFY